MINAINTDLAHRYIIMNLVVRTLERDLLYMSNLKTSSVLETLYQSLIIQANKELYEIKKIMNKDGLRATGEHRADDEITVYSFTQHRLNKDIRYISFALRNHVLKEIERLIKKSQSALDGSS